MRLTFVVAIASGSLAIGLQPLTAMAAPPDPEAILELEFAGWATQNGVPIDRLSCDVTPGEGDVCFALSGQNVTAYIPTPDGAGWQEYGPPTSTVATTTASVATGTDEEFGVAFGALGGDELENALTYTDLALTALEEFELDTAATFARLAADSYGTLYGVAIAAPGADSSLGQAVAAAMLSCETAWAESADAIDAFDIDAIDAAVLLLDDCQEKAGAVVALLG